MLELKARFTLALIFTTWPTLRRGKQEVNLPGGPQERTGASDTQRLRDGGMTDGSTSGVPEHSHISNVSRPADTNMHSMASVSFSPSPAPLSRSYVTSFCSIVSSLGQSYSPVSRAYPLTLLPPLPIPPIKLHWAKAAGFCSLFCLISMVCQGQGLCRAATCSTVSHSPAQEAYVLLANTQACEAGRNLPKRCLPLANGWREEWAGK